jgi:AraC-like DNA-binding protein
VFHAVFADHAYPPHTHDTWTLFVVDAGAVRYDLGRRDHGALPAMVTILPPGVVHDGRSADHDGFRKRVLYVEESVLGEHLVGPSVDRPEINDNVLRRDVSRIHRLLLYADDAFEAEVRLASIAERIAFHLGEVRSDASALSSNELAEALRAYLDARLFESVKLADAAAAVGANPTHLARSFGRAFGIAPHKYVLGRRIDAARSRLLDGYPSAEVAVGVGFYDQAHFIRHFKRLTGVTPGHFAANGSCR